MVSFSYYKWSEFILYNRFVGIPGRVVAPFLYGIDGIHISWSSFLVRQWNYQDTRIGICRIAAHGCIRILRIHRMLYKSIFYVRLKALVHCSNNIPCKMVAY